MRYNLNYRHHDLFMEFEEVLGNLDLFQMVDFNTWSRIVNNTLRSSLLDLVFIISFIKIDPGIACNMVICLCDP